MRKPNGELEEDPNKILQLYENYYRELLSTRPTVTKEDREAQEHKELIEEEDNCYQSQPHQSQSLANN